LIEEELMPPLPSQWLSQIGLAEFEPRARSDIELYAHAKAGGKFHPDSSTQEESFRAFIEFGAVEFALAPLYHGGISIPGQNRILEGEPLPNQVFPVHVSNSAAADAVYKTDCGPFAEHSRKDPSELRPWDVFTFAGDMSKVELLDIPGDINALAEPGIMQYVIDKLAEEYIQAGFRSRVVESGLLDAQGIVWFAKLAVLRGVDYTEMEGLQFAARFLPGSMPMA
jgi:hypothetical protein